MAYLEIKKWQNGLNTIHFVSVDQSNTFLHNFWGNLFPFDSQQVNNAQLMLSINTNYCKMSLGSLGGEGDVVVTIYKNSGWRDDEDESDTDSETDCPFVMPKKKGKESNYSFDESINGNGDSDNSNKQLDIKSQISVGGHCDDDEERKKESSCGQRFFGRADIFRPILTSEERSMLGICQIPSYFLRDKSVSSSRYLDKEKRNGKESATEYFVVSSGTIKSDLKRQRDELLETMRQQKEIDLQARKDKEVVQKLHNFKVQKVKNEYKILTKNN